MVVGVCAYLHRAFVGTTGVRVHVSRHTADKFVQLLAGD
jgi:hypothetical protein